MGKAILSEVESLVKNDTLDIVERPEEQNIVGSRVVLTNKYNSDGNIEKRKARIVAKGFSQRFGVDYHQTFAPVARLESVRLLLSLSAHFGMKIRQFDIVTAYLNGKLDEEVFMEIPDMFPDMLKLLSVKNTSHDVKQRAKKMLQQIEGGHNVCKLKRALYGLRQAGRKWYETLSLKLEEIGLHATKRESCMFHAKRNGNLLLLVVYVDDLLIASSDNNWIDEVKSKLTESFDLKDLGMAKYCLGLEITQENDCVMVNQRGYINDILNRCGMSHCNPVMTPAELKSNRPQNNTETLQDVSCVNDTKENWTYRELIGSLMYLAVGTRPDIANTVSRLAQFVNDPQRQDMVAAKRVLKYLAGSKILGIKRWSDNMEVTKTKVGSAIIYRGGICCLV